MAQKKVTYWGCLMTKGLQWVRSLAAGSGGWFGTTPTRSLDAVWSLSLSRGRFALRDPSFSKTPHEWCNLVWTLCCWDSENKRNKKGVIPNKTPQTAEQIEEGATVQDRWSGWPSALMVWRLDCRVQLPQPEQWCQTSPPQQDEYSLDFTNQSSACD